MRENTRGISSRSECILNHRWISAPSQPDRRIQDRKPVNS